MLFPIVGVLVKTQSENLSLTEEVVQLRQQLEKQNNNNNTNNNSK